MQKSNDISLKEALELMLKKYKLERKISETDILKAWIKYMGPVIAGKTTKVEFYKTKAVIYLNSAVARNEFSMQKETIIENLNLELEGNIITEIEFR